MPKPVLPWAPAPPNRLKWNTDGSAIGKPGPDGIGDVLRDWKGDFICIFSILAAVLGSNLVEILALQQALEL